MVLLFIFKELVRNNSQLLDDKHDLELKLKKTIETSKKQIEDLEAVIENLNYQIKSSKGNECIV